MKTEAGTGAVQPPAQECSRPPGAGRGEEQAPPPEPLQGAQPSWHLDYGPLALRSVRE